MAVENLLKICPLTLTRVGGLPISELEKMRCDGSVLFQNLLVFEKKQATAAHDLLEKLSDLLELLPNSTTRTQVFNLRRQFFQKKNLPQQKLEAALAPLDLPESSAALAAFSIWHIASRDLADQIQLFENQCYASLYKNFESLKNFAESEVFQRSMLFSSHDLLITAQKFPTEKTKKQRQIALSVWQFFARAAAKTSPLSRLTTVHFSNENADEAPIFFEEIQSKISPNVALLEAIYHALLPYPAFFRSLKMTLNPSLVRLETEFKFLFFDGETESLQSLVVSPILEKIANYIIEKQQITNFENLKLELENWTDAAPGDCENYLLQLVEIGFLEWHLPEPGHSPTWCSGLIAALQFLPAEPPISETIFLLRNLQTAARTLPFQAVEQAIETQKNVREQVVQWFMNLKNEPPPLAPEQIFYEDIMKKPAGEILGKDIEAAVADLTKYLNIHGLQVETAMQTAVRNFVEQARPAAGQPFPLFAGKFIEWRRMQANLKLERKKLSLPPGKIGAMLQFFRAADGAMQAVVNAIFPGGGKMFQRWLPLAPENLQLLKNWTDDSSSAGQIRAPFPWMGWHNANFFSNLTAVKIEVQGGRDGKFSGRKIRLADLQVEFSETGQAFLSYENQRVVLDDCGLEALHHRPPAMQLLWHLGVQNYSTESLNCPPNWQPTGAAGVFFSPRHEFGRLVLRRAAWRFSENFWKNWLPQIGQSFQFFKNLHAAQQQFGWPGACFFRLEEKPQLIDFQVAVSILHFEKTLRQSSGDLILTEMLPAPNSVLENHVSETVVEFEFF